MLDKENWNDPGLLCPSGQTWAQNGRKTPVLVAELDGRGGKGQLIRRDLSGFMSLLT